MSDKINRKEQTHIDERTGTARCTVQWLLENRNIKGSVSHPITHNNHLTMFICGQEGFGDIAKELRRAACTIDICCWGFDPGMELERSATGTWPRGETYGDLLIAAGKRGVRVRLLIWHDGVADLADRARNMPGYTHDTCVWRIDPVNQARADQLGARNSLAALKEALRSGSAASAHPNGYIAMRASRKIPVRESEVSTLARQEYCYTWYRAAMSGKLKNIEVRMHGGDSRSIGKTLKREDKQFGISEQAFIEYFGTHHQKPILIDFAHDGGSKAVGYVMGLNSLTDYWDTVGHKLDDPLREEEPTKLSADGSPEEKGYRWLKPYRDYACRIDGGGALVSVYNNFIEGWNRVEPDAARRGQKVALNGEAGGLPCPPHLLRKPKPGDSTAQIVRTQPTEGDQTIRELYFKAADNAALAFRYLYVENQYFQYEEWTKRLLEKREQVMDLWSEAGTLQGKKLADMPMLHVFVVIPVPEIEEMIPRTYDALARIGQQDAMQGQQKLIDEENKRVEAEEATKRHPLTGSFALPKAVRPLPEVVQYANTIEKPSPKVLENNFGIKVCTAMLNTSAPTRTGRRYREIYIHSKLLLVDDVFCMLGSANLNTRSMAADSEINVATTDSGVARDLRQRIWRRLYGGEPAGECESQKGIAEAFRNWASRMKDNKAAQDKGEALTGFLLPLRDERSSITRLG